jgi:predicted transcriptional regulator of viral defense system
MRRQQAQTGSTKAREAITIFKHRNGFLRMADALRAGIHRRTLHSLLDAGTIERLSRGLYRLTEAPALGNPDLVTVALRVPKGVICLPSALAYHELTTHIPHEIYVAIARDNEPPRVSYPPIRSFRFSGRVFSEGIETPRIDGVPIRIYDREKTLADCFKHRNKLGLDTTLEALRLYKQQGRVNIEALTRYAEICRVTRILSPYLEAVL